MLRGSAAGAAPALTRVNWVLSASAGAKKKKKPDWSSFRSANVKDTFEGL